MMTSKKDTRHAEFKWFCLIVALWALLFAVSSYERYIAEENEKISNEHKIPS